MTRRRTALLTALAVLGATGTGLALSHQDQEGADPLAALAPVDARLAALAVPSGLSACGSDVFATPVCWESTSVPPVRAARLLADALTGTGATDVDPRCAQKRFPTAVLTYCQLGGVLDGTGLDTLVEEQVGVPGCAPTAPACGRRTRVRAIASRGRVPDLLTTGTRVPVP